MSVNLMIAMGNIAREIELRYTPTGKPVSSGSIALNRTWKNESGDKMEQVTFLDFSAFGNTAEALAQYVKKGQLIHLTGYLKQDGWDDKATGQKRTKIQLVVEKFAFCGKRDETEAEPKEEKPKRRGFSKPMSDEAKAEVKESKPDPDDDAPF